MMVIVVLIRWVLILFQSMWPSPLFFASEQKNRWDASLRLENFILMINIGSYGSVDGRRSRNNLLCQRGWGGSLTTVPTSSLLLCLWELAWWICKGWEGCEDLWPLWIKSSVIAFVTMRASTMQSTAKSQSPAGVTTRNTSEWWQSSQESNKLGSWQFDDCCQKKQPKECAAVSFSSPFNKR